MEKLNIGLAPGSTKVIVRRAEIRDALPIEISEEALFDETFRAIVESIAMDQRPDWISDTLAVAAGKLRSALEDAAPVVEFAAGGEVGTIFRTTDTHRETWRASDVGPENESIEFVGRLRAVNLDTHRLQVTDDVGNRVTLVNVDDADVGPLLDEYVTVVGLPERDPTTGRLTQIHGAALEATPPAPFDVGVGAPPADSLEALLASAPGPRFGGLIDLSDDEADGLLDALGL